MLTDGQNFKFGRTWNIRKRLAGHRSTVEGDFALICFFRIRGDDEVAKLEKEIHQIARQYYKTKKEWYPINNYGIDMLAKWFEEKCFEQSGGRYYY